MINRRKFLIDGSKAFLALNSLSMMLSGRAFSTDQLDFKVAITETVKRKWGNSGKALRILYPKGSHPNVSVVAKLFESLTNIPVVLIEGSLEDISSEVLIEKKLNGIEGSFDIALPATYSIPDLVEAKAILDLSAFEDRHDPKKIGRKSLYSIGDSYKGKLYGYQTDGDAYLMFYNKDWLTDASIQKRYSDIYSTELKIPVTWHELDQQMSFFHEPEKNHFGGSLFRNRSYAVWEFWSRLHAKGLLPVTNEFAPQFAGSEGVEALKDLIDATQFLDPGVVKDGLFTNWKSFAEGNKFCNIGWGGTQKMLNAQGSPMRGKLAYGLLPGGKLGKSEITMPFFNWGWNYVVTTFSPHSELAYLFCLFATRPDVSTQAVKQVDGFFDPFHKEHYKDPDVVSIYSQDFLDVHKDSMLKSFPDFYMRGQTKYFSALREAVSASIKRQVSPEVALNKAAEKWNEITQIIGREEQVKQWAFVKNSYPDYFKKALK